MKSDNYYPTTNVWEVTELQNACTTFAMRARLIVVDRANERNYYILRDAKEFRTSQRFTILLANPTALYLRETST